MKTNLAQITDRFVPLARHLAVVLVYSIVLFVLVTATVAQSERQLDKSQDASASSAMGRPCPVPSPPPSDTKCYAGSGCLDVTFGNDGLVTTFLNSSPANNIQKVLIQPDGKIVGAGQVSNSDTGTAMDFLVVRYDPDGSLDTTFGDVDPVSPWQRLGYTFTVFSTGNDWSRAAALQPDGKIIAGGYSYDTWAVARYNTDGTLDTTFDGDGKLTINITAASVQEIALQSDGKILITGEPNFTVVRLNTNGSLDSTFGTGGRLTVNPSTNRNGRGHPWSIVVQRIPAVTGEERIVVGGWAASGTSAALTFALMRFTSGGAVDTSFGSGGRVLTSFFGFGDQARDLIIDTSNRIVSSGFIRSSNCSGAMDFGLARYSENGVLDPSFSGDGKLGTDVYGGDNNPGGLALQSDGKLVIAGTSRYPNSGNFWDFTLVRYHADGTPDNSFGPGFLGTGVVTTQFPSTNSNWAFSVALQQDGNIVAGGVASGKLALARYLP